VTNTRMPAGRRQIRDLDAPMRAVRSRPLLVSRDPPEAIFEAWTATASVQAAVRILQRRNAGAGIALL